MKVDLKAANAKLRSREKRTHQNVSREQVECAKLSKQISKLTAQIDRMASDLKEAKAASVNLVPAKQSTSKPAVKKEQASRKTSSEPEVISLVRNPAKQMTPPTAVQSESYQRIREKLEKNGTLKT
jgi:hypothetical protein